MNQSWRNEDGFVAWIVMGLIAVSVVARLAVGGFTLPETFAIQQEAVQDATHGPAVFVILGEIRNPGEYVFAPEMTISQAMCLAGGMTERGSDRKITVFRFINHERQEIDVRTTDIVQPNDIIRIHRRLIARRSGAGTTKACAA